MMSTESHARRAFLRQGGAAVAALAGLGVGHHAAAQAAVEQLHMLCSGPAGSIPDIVARRVAAPPSASCNRQCCCWPSGPWWSLPCSGPG